MSNPSLQRRLEALEARMLATPQTSDADPSQFKLWRLSDRELHAIAELARSRLNASGELCRKTDEELLQDSLYGRIFRRLALPERPDEEKVIGKLQGEIGQAPGLPPVSAPEDFRPGEENNARLSAWNKVRSDAVDARFEEAVEQFLKVDA